MRRRRPPPATHTVPTIPTMMYLVMTNNCHKIMMVILPSSFYRCLTFVLVYPVIASALSSGHWGSPSSCCRSRRRRPPTPTALSASTNSNINDLPSHYTSPSVLSWLSNMATSYKLDRGEDLFDVILRESSSEVLSEPQGTTTSPLLRLAIACATTNLPIASHDFLRDPNRIAIYNYGNLAFLHGFGYEWEEFVQLPSSKCVETPGEVEERQRLLDAVLLQQANASKNNDDGVSTKYDNLIRVRKDGRKILLKGVNLWNVYDCTSFEGDTLDNIDVVRAAIETGETKAIGQAVWIRNVEYLD